MTSTKLEPIGTTDETKHTLKPVKRETMTTRIYTCHRDFAPVKITSEN